MAVVLSFIAARKCNGPAHLQSINTSSSIDTFSFAAHFVSFKIKLN